MMSKRVVRYGLSRDLFRVLSVTRNWGTACAGNTLHLVEGIRVRDGELCRWCVRDSDLPAYV